MRRIKEGLSDEMEIPMLAVVLAGGRGTRLFPLSRKHLPKQFLKIGSHESLLQKTIKRILKIIDHSNIVIITNKDYQSHIKTQLKEIGISNKEHIILEPAGRNTAPAIALAAKYAIDKLHYPPDEVLFICPSDHIISPYGRFVKYVKQAEKIAKRGYIVTFGTEPYKPETGYGYIKKAEELTEWQEEGIEAYKVERFEEKPDLNTAQEYLLSNNYLWNSGMFAFTIDIFFQELKKYAPTVCESIEGKTYTKVLKGFEGMPSISIDYAIMEKSDKIAVLPIDVMWSDIGSWDSMYDVMEKDENGNVKVGNIIEIDTKNSLIIGDKKLIATMDVEDIIIIETGDALVITKRGKSQKIKEIMDALSKDDHFTS